MKAHAYDSAVTRVGQAPRLPTRLQRLGRRLWAELRLTGLAAWRAMLGFYNSDDLTFASSIGYYALLSLFPIFLLAFAILGSVTADDADRAAVLAFVLRYFPRQFDFVTAQLDAMRRTHLTLGVTGTLVLTWAALGVFGAITSAVNHAWGVERQPSYLKHKLVSFIMLAAAGVILVFALLLVSAIGFAESSRFASAVGRLPGQTLLLALKSFMVKYTATALLIFVVGLIFYFVPNAKVRFKDVWVGAIITGLLWRGALFGFQWYVRDITRFSVIHGSIAAVVVFLLWVYVSAVIMLYGVEFTAAYARLRRHRSEAVPAAPTPRT